MLVLRADNRGEGGIMALLALAASRRSRPAAAARASCCSVGVVGAALFYGDAVLTPAISVLSAVEGLEVGTTCSSPTSCRLRTGVLVALFVIQRHGTGVVGLLFGPVCVAWFAALARRRRGTSCRQPQILGCAQSAPCVRAS